MIKSSLLVTCLLLFESAIPSGLTQRGPYKTELMTISNCSVTTLPPAPNSPFLIILEKDKKTGYVNGNVTIVANDVTNLKESDGTLTRISRTPRPYETCRLRLPGLREKRVKVQIFLWENGEWTLSLNVPGYSCNRPFLRGLLAATKLKGDRTKCSLSKGFYNIRNIDVDVVNHLWLFELDYGTVMSRSEIMDKKHTHMCVEAVMKITPKQKKRS